MSYREKEKSIVREAVLSKAVKALTADRTISTLLNADYIYRVKNELSRDKYCIPIVDKLRDITINKWSRQYEALVSERKPSQLRVAHLSGPNPENDLDILTRLGSLPENVWAFESNNMLYSSALQSILNSRFPHIKIQKSNISDFFKTSPLKFDIIYLDFCGPLPNKNKKQNNC